MELWENFLGEQLRSKAKSGFIIDKKRAVSSAEKLIQEFFYNRKLKYIINRFGVIAGPWQFGKQDQGFVSLWVWKHMNRKKLSYIGVLFASLNLIEDLG